MTRAPTRYKIAGNVYFLRDSSRAIDTADGELTLLAVAYGDTQDEAKANAAFIVKACNSHDALVEIAEAAKEVEADHEIRATVLVSSVSQYKLRRLHTALNPAKEA